MFIRKIIRELASLVIRFFGISLIIRNTIARNKVTILSYHNPKPDVLEKHINYLTKRYNFITLDLLVDAIYSRNWTNIPKKSIIITLDDGHKSNFMLLEVFKKYKVKPTIYICSQIVDTNRQFWFKVTNVNSEHLKHCSNIDRLRFLNRNFKFTPIKEFPNHERQALNSKEIMLMKDFVDFQSHSRFHHILPSCTYENARKEIFRSKKELEELLCIECKHFAYPNGNYTGREIELLKNAGYLSARTIDVGWNDIQTNPYALNITGITDDASVNMMVAQLSGLTMYLQYLMKASFKGRHPNFRLSKRIE